MRGHDLKETDRQVRERERERMEHEFKMKDLELAKAIRLKELDIKAREAGIRIPTDHFDVVRNVRLVPPFKEKELDTFLKGSLHFSNGHVKRGPCFCRAFLWVKCSKLILRCL